MAKKEEKEKPTKYERYFGDVPFNAKEETPMVEILLTMKKKELIS